MLNKLFNFLVLVITVLAVHLITGGITEYLMKYKGITHPLKFTLIGMLITVIILYPAFKYIDKMLKNLTAKLMLKGAGAFSRTLGIFIVFLLLFAVLYWFYARKWFHIDVLRIAVNYLK